MTLLILTIIGLSAYYYIKSSQTDRSGRQDPHAYAYARNEHPEILDRAKRLVDHAKILINAF